MILKGSFFLYTCFILLLSLIGLTEFYRMALPERKIESAVAATAGALLPLTFIAQNQKWLLLVLTLFVLLSGLIFLFRIVDIGQTAGEVALTLAGLLYIPLLLGHLILLRGVPHGIQWTFLLLVIVMSGDTGAYYIGCRFGRRKLYPAVSPNKSVEGAVGGLFGSIAGAVIVKFSFFPELTLPDAFLAALLLGVLGQLGDLFESLLKRSFGVKDSGAIIPGHGGILDRLDSILFAAPAAYYYALIIFSGR